MKKLFMITMIGLAFVTSSFASSKSDKPDTAEFNKLLASSQITWKITDEFKKATVLVGREQTEIFYSKEGRLIGTSKSFAYNKLPKAAIQYISLNYAYPEYSLIECISFEKAYEETNYYVSLLKNNRQVNLKINASGSVEEME